MTRLWLAVFTGGLSFGISSLTIPLVMRVARKYGVLDHPDVLRRAHPEPVPRLGGVAIFAGICLSIVLVQAWDLFDARAAVTFPPVFPGLIAGVSIVFLTGVLDDVSGVRPSTKLIAQFLAALCAMAYGFRIQTITFAGAGALDLGPLAYVITPLWVVGMTNAFNFVDGVDGLAGYLGIVAILTCVMAGSVLHDGSMSIFAAAMLGTTIGFLRYNVAPARIFLGDSGSMILGYLLSIVTVVSATTADGITWVVIPILALAYPLLDMAIAISRRWIRGQPIAEADSRHVHHRLLALGFSPRRTVELLTLTFGGIAVAGLVIMMAPPTVTLPIAMGFAVLLALVLYHAVRWLGYNEFVELGGSVKSVLLNARAHVQKKVFAGDVAERLTAAESFEQVSAMLADAAPGLRLIDISVVAGSPEIRRPEARQIAPLSDQPFRLDFPISWDDGGQVREVVLRLWCDRPTSHQHLGVDQLATRLGRSLERWLKEHPGALQVPVSNLEHRANRMGAPHVD